MTKITIAVTGSIAAYKSADIISELTKLGHDVTVLMTQAAQQFITPLTLQVLSKNKVHTDLFSEDCADSVTHIAIAKATEVFLVAPASADTIARLSQGRADDIISAVTLALPPHVIKLVAPAMNTNMYENQATKTNLKTLNKLGFVEIEPRASLLACGDFGKGALAHHTEILATIQQQLENISSANTFSC